MFWILIPQPKIERKLHLSKNFWHVSQPSQILILVTQEKEGSEKIQWYSVVGAQLLFWYILITFKN